MEKVSDIKEPLPVVHETIQPVNTVTPIPRRLISLKAYMAREKREEKSKNSPPLLPSQNGIFRHKKPRITISAARETYKSKSCRL